VTFWRPRSHSARPAVIQRPQIDSAPEELRPLALPRYAPGCAIEVAYIFASVKAITVKGLVRENTTRKELHPLELKSKVTTEFAYNSTSRGLHKEYYCRIDVISEMKCM